MASSQQTGAVTAPRRKDTCQNPFESQQPGRLIVQEIAPHLPNPLALHCQLEAQKFDGHLIIIGDVDPRTLSGIRAHAQACGLNTSSPSDTPITQGLSAGACKLPSPSELFQALEQKHIVPYYQPIFCARTGQPHRVEVLARWITEQGDIPFGPAQFIQVAEDCGAIEAVFDAMLIKSLKELSPLLRQGQLQSMSLNLSPGNLQNTNLADHLQSRLAPMGLEPHQLILEITENQMALNEPILMACLARLHLAGFPIAIDDFGTGISGLSKLRQLPFSELKIDRSFTRCVHKDPINQAICKGIISIASALEMTIVAEGVECEEEGAWMIEQGVSDLQGYHHATPMSIEALDRLTTSITPF